MMVLSMYTNFYEPKCKKLASTRVADPHINFEAVTLQTTNVGSIKLTRKAL